MGVETSHQAENRTFKHFHARRLVSWLAVFKSCELLVNQTFRVCFAAIMRLIKIGVVQKEHVSGMVARQLSYLFTS